jgi:hypothetical protein
MTIGGTVCALATVAQRQKTKTKNKTPQTPAARDRDELSKLLKSARIATPPLNGSLFEKVLPMRMFPIALRRSGRPISPSIERRALMPDRFRLWSGFATAKCEIAESELRYVTLTAIVKNHFFLSITFSALINRLRYIYVAFPFCRPADLREPLRAGLPSSLISLSHYQI